MNVMTVQRDTSTYVLLCFLLVTIRGLVGLLVILFVFYFFRLIVKMQGPTIFLVIQEFNLYTNQDHFHYHHSVSYSHLKSKVGNILTKLVTKIAALRINLNIDDTPMSSRSFTECLPPHTRTTHKPLVISWRLYRPNHRLPQPSRSLSGSCTRSLVSCVQRLRVNTAGLSMDTLPTDSLSKKE